MELPSRKKRQKLLAKHLSQATVEKPLRLYVGSCPDYAHDGNKYTHTGISGGVPLLTQFHLQASEGFLQELDIQQIPYEYIVMVADVEAIDEVFCNRFTGGDEERFLGLCSNSVRATEAFMAGNTLLNNSSNRLVSSSFFGEFGRERFLNFQHSYSELLQKRFQSDRSFNTRVVGDIIARTNLYRKMYPDVFRNDIGLDERDSFLVGRTIRTMAQYLVLGRLIGEKSDECFPVIICHPTKNIGFFNDRNKFLLPTDGTFPQPTIPVIKMKKEVY